MVNTVRALAQEKFKPRVKKWEDGTFPFENIKDLADIGVLGMAVPEEYGGMGLPVLDCVVVLEEIANSNGGYDNSDHRRPEKGNGPARARLLQYFNT